MAELFYLGIGIVVITWLYGLTKATTYNSENQNQVAKTQRILCMVYGIGFLVLAFGAYNFFISKAWWTWIIIIGSAMMGFGAFQEARARFPNAPKGYGQEE